MLCKVSCLLSVLLFFTHLLSGTANIVKRQVNSQPKKTSFTRYVEYAETPFSRPSYFSVPYKVPPNNELHYITNEMFAHLIREHARHQQRIRLMNQNKYSSRDDPQLASTREPILRGVSHITELRQTPFQRQSSPDTSTLSYEEKRRRWKEELKKRMRSNKQTPAGGSEPVGTAGRYYITFNPYSNAYQVSRRLPSYVRKEDLEPEMTPDTPLSTIVQTTSTTTTPAPVVIVQQATEVTESIEQTVRIPAASKPKKGSSSIRQILNLDYYDDEFGPESEESEPEQILVTTQRPTTTPRPTTTQKPTTTPRPTTTQNPTTTQRPIIYPAPTTQRPYYPTTTYQTKSSLFASYEDDDQPEEDDEDFMWFKPGAQQKPGTQPTTENDPFSIVVHEGPQ